MTRKPKSRKGAAVAAPNKQRLILMTKAEKLAALSGGCVDERIPQKDLRQILRDEPGRTFEIDAVLYAIGVAAGRCRGCYSPGQHSGQLPPRMEPGEILKQARATVAVIDELRERLENIHPHIAAWADVPLWRKHSIFLHDLHQRIDPGLLEIKAAIEHAHRTLSAQKAPPGPKQNQWMKARSSIETALREHSTPQIALKVARALSEDILKLCGLKSVRKGR